MTNPEQIDNELAAMLAEGNEHAMEDFVIECNLAAVNETLWTTIEATGISLAMGRDPATYDDDIDALHRLIIQEFSTQPLEDDETEEMREQKIELEAYRRWDDDWRFLNEMGLALYRQQYEGLNATEKELFKKEAMASALVGEQEPERWQILYDTLLEGEPLDLSKPSDLAILAAAEKEQVNYASHPIILLYGAVARKLGVSPDGLITVTKDDVKERAYAARDITEAIHHHAGIHQQPNRHEAIHAIIIEYELALTSDEVTNILNLADDYASKE